MSSLFVSSKFNEEIGNHEPLNWNNAHVNGACCTSYYYYFSCAYFGFSKNDLSNLLNLKKIELIIHNKFNCSSIKNHVYRIVW